MIIGIGTDLVSIPRLVRSLERSGDSFARHVLADEEWDDYVAVKDKARFLAKRFAVKEAFAKACGTGIRFPLSLSKIWVEHDELGCPSLQVAPDVKTWLTDKAGPWISHLSISDEKEVATAFIVLETS